MLTRGYTLTLLWVALSLGLHGVAVGPVRAGEFRLVPACGLRDAGEDQAPLGVPKLAVPKGVPAPLYFVIQGGTPPFTVKWEFGDQSPEEKRVYEQGRLVHTTHAYGLNQDQRRAYVRVRVTATDAQGLPPAAADRDLRIEETADPQILRWLALERALWFLHTKITDSPGKPAFAGETYPMAAHALALQAFSNAGHNPFDDPRDDPYVEDARALLATLCKGFVKVEENSFAAFDKDPKNGRLLYLAADPFGEASRPPNAIRWHFDTRMYEMPMVLMALASIDQPRGSDRSAARVAILGRHEPEPLRQVTQDLVETLLAAQRDGGWRYNLGQEPDFSVTQWPVIALEAWEHTLKRTGAMPPSGDLQRLLGDARSGLKKFLEGCLDPDGTIRYLRGTPRQSPALTAAGLCAASWLDLPYDGDMVASIRKGLIDHWAEVKHDRLETYAMYSIMKALRNFEDKGQQVSSGLLTDRAGRQKEWFEEFADAIVRHQDQKDGSIRSSFGKVQSWVRPFDPNGTLETCLGALCLEPRIYDPAPLPWIRTIPESDLPLRVIVDHSASISGVSQPHIKNYIWDVEGEPTLHWTTGNRLGRHLFAFPRPGTYRLRLTTQYEHHGRLASSSIPKTIQVTDKPAALGRIIPPDDYAIGPFLAHRKNQVALIPVGGVEFYDSSRGWERLSIQWRSQANAELGVPIEFSPRARFIAREVRGDADLPGQCTIASIPSESAQSISLKAGSIELPEGFFPDCASRPFVLVKGLSGFKNLEAALCLVLEDRKAWNSRITLHWIARGHFGLAVDRLPEGVASIFAARLLIFSDEELDTSRASTLERIPIKPVKIHLNEGTLRYHTGRAHEEMLEELEAAERAVRPPD